jgi:hypothetical protein
MEGITMNKLVKLMQFALIFFGSPYALSQASTFMDNFNDGIIDNSFWVVSGDGVSESGGMLNISRNSAADSIKSSSSFSGAFSIEFDMLLKKIEWRDTFHGISLFDASNNGVSFGFSKYGQFFTGITTNGGTSFNYTGGIMDPDAFTINTWYHFTLTGVGSNYVSFFANDSVIFSQSMNHMSDFSIYLPGYYSDGGLGTSTDSVIDNFSFENPPIPAPLPSAILLLCSGLAVLGVTTKRKRHRIVNEKSFLQ